jgi:hypothetical protein
MTRETAAPTSSDVARGGRPNCAFGYSVDVSVHSRTALQLIWNEPRFRVAKPAVV